MARDRKLEQLIHDHLNFIPGITSKAMFGGWAWLLDGKLLCGVRDEGMIVRLGPGESAWMERAIDIGPMMSRGKRMRGWVHVGPDVIVDNAIRQELLADALAFVRTLLEP